MNNAKPVAPRVMVLHAPGTNRDREAVFACNLAGGAAEIVHINQLVAGQRELASYQMLVIPGGFSYGDDLGAGRLWANDLYHRLRQDLDVFVEQGKPVIGICNGFQTLVKAGYLPGPAPKQQVTLTFNQYAHFECRWVRLRAVAPCRSLFTAGMEQDILCPVAHGEGRFAIPDEATRQMLWDEQMVAIRYVAPICDSDADNAAATVPVKDQAGYPANPNGSVDDIAGICNRAGNVLGLMPHPEDHVFAQQYPRWHRGAFGGLGLVLFTNGVRAAQSFS